jgi:hypothetical protein
LHRRSAQSGEQGGAAAEYDRDQLHPDLVLLGDQPHLQHPGSKVQVGVASGRLGEPTGLGDELQPGGEVARTVEA